MTENYPSLSPELRRLLRKNLWGALLSLVLLGALAALLMTHFRPHVEAVTAWIFAEVGLPGIFAILFITDAFVSPLPPDSVLLLVAASPYHQDWLLWVPLMGLSSSVAGCVGYGAGTYLSGRTWAESWLGPFRTRSEKMIRKYGSWAVVLGALTPVPFSITCWTAGLLRVPFNGVWIPCLLRVPRYVVYYAAIAYSPELLR